MDTEANFTTDWSQCTQLFSNWPPITDNLVDIEGSYWILKGYYYAIKWIKVFDKNISFEDYEKKASDFYIHVLEWSPKIKICNLFFSGMIDAARKQPILKKALEEYQEKIGTKNSLEVATSLLRDSQICLNNEYKEYFENWKSAKVFYKIHHETKEDLVQENLTKLCLYLDKLKELSLES